jgi:hypothetical protein
MGSEFTFYDYFDASGNNVIKGWLDGDGYPVKAFFNRMIAYLKESSPPGSQDSFWTYPYTWPLHEDWDDFFELRRKAKGVEYRLIGQIVGRKVYLVTWGYHKGNWETDVTQQTARMRVTQMEKYLKLRREHDNS